MNTLLRFCLPKNRPRYRSRGLPSLKLVTAVLAIGGTAQQYDLTDLGGSTSLQAQVNGKLVCAEIGRAAPLIANRDAIDPWEQFDLISN